MALIIGTCGEFFRAVCALDSIRSSKKDSDCPYGTKAKALLFFGCPWGRWLHSIYWQTLCPQASAIARITAGRRSDLIAFSSASSFAKLWLSKGFIPNLSPVRSFFKNPQADIELCENYTSNILEYRTVCVAF